MGCAGDKYANAPVSVTKLASLDGCVEWLSVVLKLSSRGTRPALRWKCSHCARLMLRNDIYEFIQRRVAEAGNVTSVDTRRGHRANSHAAGWWGLSLVAASWTAPVWLRGAPEAAGEVALWSSSLKGRFDDVGLAGLELEEDEFHFYFRCT